MPLWSRNRVTTKAGTLLWIITDPLLEQDPYHGEVDPYLQISAEPRKKSRAGSQLYMLYVSEVLYSRSLNKNGQDFLDIHYPHQRDPHSESFYPKKNID